jgi:Holliday junction resolvasome RuvABC endonuclease subunit
MRGGPATDLLVGMTTRVVEICAERNIDHQPVHSATLKKAATGSGRAEKDAMIKAAKKRFPGIEILSDDHADALCLLDYAVKEYCTL